MTTTTVIPTLTIAAKRIEGGVENGTESENTTGTVIGVKRVSGSTGTTTVIGSARENAIGNGNGTTRENGGLEGTEIAKETGTETEIARGTEPGRGTTIATLIDWEETGLSIYIDPTRIGAPVAMQM